MRNNHKTYCVFLDVASHPQISIESPLGKALLGHKEGDRVFIKVNDDFGYYVIVKKVIKTQSEDEDHIRSF